MPHQLPEPSPAVIRIRQLRGLIIHYRIANPDGPPTVYRRNLIRTLPPVRRFDGVCRWCRRPTNKPRTVWHQYCVHAYVAAQGLQHDIYQQPLISRQPCPCGQPGQEIDHHVALSVAHATGSTRTILRAYMLDNLTFLCKNCHAAKSGLDRRTVNNLRQGRPADFRRHDTKTPPKDQMSLF